MYMYILYIYTYIYIHRYKYIYIYIPVHIYIYTFICECICVHVAFIYIYIHTCIHELEVDIGVRHEIRRGEQREEAGLYTLHHLWKDVNVFETGQGECLVCRKICKVDVEIDILATGPSCKKVSKMNNYRNLAKYICI